MKRWIPLPGTILVTLISAHALSPVRPWAAEPRAAWNLSGTVPGSTEMKADQVNVAGWTKAWTNLVNDVEQTFTPSMPRLQAVEVELVVGNRNAPDDDLTLTIMDEKGDEIESISQIVNTTDCEHSVFVLQEGGIEVTPGEPYRIRLSGATTFGWKYVVGGYPKGAATFNGKPLLDKARSTFLFRTFGSE